MSIRREYITLHDINSMGESPSGDSGYCPISVKDEMNPPAENYFDKVTNSQLFLSDKNRNHITEYIITHNIKQQTGNNLKQLEIDIPQIMANWCKEHELDDFEFLFDNDLLTLVFINHRFLTDNDQLYQNNKITNVFRDKAMVTDSCGNKSMKKYAEMTADDYKTIDVWKPEQLYTYDKLNRYGNKAETWRKHQGVRHYDRDFQGARSTKSRASLGNQSHGYDMSNIKKGSTFYNNYFYENA